MTLFIFTLIASVVSQSAVSLKCHSLFADQAEEIHAIDQTKLFDLYRLSKSGPEFKLKLNEFSKPELFISVIDIVRRANELGPYSTFRSESEYVVGHIVEHLIGRKWSGPESAHLQNLYQDVSSILKQSGFNFEKKELHSRLDELVNKLIDVAYFRIDYQQLNAEDQTRIKHGTNQHMWIGTSPEVLNTSYEVIQQIIDHPLLSKAKKIADMGAGIGRLGLFIGTSRPDLDFTGYEYLAYRMERANEYITEQNIKNVNFVQADFTDPNLKLENADVFFTYWSNSDSSVMQSMFNKLRSVARKKKILIVTRFLTEYDVLEMAPWLKPVTQYNSLPFQIFESSL